MSKNDFREDLANRLIAAAEKGDAFWQRPWNAGDIQEPHNAITGKAYSGINAVQLMMSSPDPSDNRWATYKQAQAQGWQVKTGAKGVQVEKWVDLSKTKSQQIDGQEDPKQLLVPKHYTVFHASQIDGIPPIERPAPRPAVENDKRIETLAANMGVTIENGGDKAYYSPLKDAIRMPNKDQFESGKGYDTVLLHELSHATGHPSRLARPLLNKFGTAEYAKEELRAELSSAMTAASLGIGYAPAEQSREQGREELNSAGYLKSWIGAIPEADRQKEILGAVKDAHTSSNYLLERTPNLRIRPDLTIKPKEPALEAPERGRTHELPPRRKSIGL